MSKDEKKRRKIKDKNLLKFLLSKCLEEVTSLDANCLDIKDLTGVETMKNIQFLSLRENSIGALPDSFYLEKITNLDLSYNNIGDIVRLGNLLTLERLDLYENNIKDVSFLSKLVNLKSLDIGGNSVSKEEYEKIQYDLPFCRIIM